MKKAAILILAILLAAAALAGCGEASSGSAEKTADELFVQGEVLMNQMLYIEAASVFEEISEKDISESQKQYAMYLSGEALFKAGGYEDSQTIYKSLGVFADSKSQAALCSLMQLKNEIDSMTTDVDAINALLPQCLVNGGTREDAIELMRGGLRHYMESGSYSIAYSLVSEHLIDYPQEFLEEGCDLAFGFMENHEYTRAIEIMKWILSGDRDEASGLLQHCPDAIIRQIYASAQSSEESKQLLEMICSSEWLFNKLQFSNVELDWGIGENISAVGADGDMIDGIRDQFHAVFTVENNGPVPIGGSFLVTMKVAGGIGGPTKTVVFDTKGVLLPGESRLCESETWSYDSFGDYGDAVDEVDFSAISGEFGLEVYTETVE